MGNRSALELQIHMQLSAEQLGEEAENGAEEGGELSEERCPAILTGRIRVCGLRVVVGRHVIVAVVRIGKGHEPNRRNEIIGNRSDVAYPARCKQGKLRGHRDRKHGSQPENNADDPLKYFSDAHNGTSKK